MLKETFSMKACPVCRHDVQEGQRTCPFCKLDFAKWQLSTASKLFSPETTWVTPPCPKCGKYFTQRVAAEDAVDMTATLRGNLSYRCQLCTELFRALPPAPKKKAEETPATETRRHYLRVPVNFPVRLWSGQRENPFAGTVTEIAMGGCSLEVDVVLAQGAQVKMELSVAERETPVVIRKATVCSIRPKGFGIEFTDLQPDEKIQLGRIMEELLASAIADCRRAVDQ
jgi:hypothetical protein